MDDYLSDLVTRNIGTAAAVIVPRRPSRFEPSQTTAALQEIELPFRTERFEEEQLIELISPVRSRREARLIEKNPETPNRETSDDQIERVSSVTPTEIHPPEPNRTDARATFTPKRIETARESNGENLPVSNISKLPTPLTPPAPAQPSPESAKEQEASGTLAENAPTRTHRALPSETNELKTPPVKNVEPQIVEARNKIVVAPRIEKAATRAEESAVQSTTISPLQKIITEQISQQAEMPPTSPPVINVTIGRVEIRAAVAPAPPKPTPAKSPTIGLDEYLRKRRAGGER